MILTIGILFYWYCEERRKSRQILSEAEAFFYEWHKAQISKRVRFPDENNIAKVHIVPNEYMVSRRGPWEQFARDRERFKRRIASTEAIVFRVLEEKHRRQVYDKSMRALTCPDKSGQV